MINFLGIEKEFSDFHKARAVILPFPYEKTTSYIGGTEKGPQAILEASAFVELFDEESGAEAYKQGIHTADALSFVGDVEDDFKAIEQAVARNLASKKFVVGLGGEHSISFPIVRAFRKYFADLSVLQLDAHSDLRGIYEGSKFSHACVMRRIYEINPHIVQLGIRSQCAEEAAFIKENGITAFYAHNMRKRDYIKSAVNALSDNVFITIDVDFFDPSVMPSTGTPEPGGFLWNETLDFLREVFKRKNVLGFDVVELSPVNGLVHADFMVARLIYKLLGYRFANSA